MSLTVEQLEAARAERMRQNGHGAITIEDVRTWIEETGLCIFLPRSAQAGFTAPTFVEAVAGQRTTEPTLELITTAEALLVRLEAEGVAVRLNLAGQPLSNTGDQPDYIVASWVLPYIYALRGDRDWRRSPQLTGSRQVSQLAVYTAKHLDSANLNSAQLRDALGREVTETAVLRALHELWKQLRVIPVVPELGVPALWQPLRQRFQKAIAEGASTSQVTAISVLASIYLQAVIAASMEDVEMFLSPLTSRSKIREVVRGLAATRQVHTTTMGHSPMFYVAGTLPEFPAVPSFQINSGYPPYRGSSYLGTDPDQSHEDEFAEPVAKVYDLTPRQIVSSYAAQQTIGDTASNSSSTQNGSPSPSGFSSSSNGNAPASHSLNGHSENGHSPAAEANEAEIPASTTEQSEKEAKALRRKQPLVNRPAARPAPRQAAPAPVSKSTPKPSAPRPRTAGPVNPRDQRSRTASSSDSRPSASASGARHRAPAPRSASGNGNAPRQAAGAARNGVTRNGAAPARSFSNANGHGANAKSNGNGAQASRPASRNGSAASGTSRPDSRTNSGSGARPAAFRPANGKGVHANTVKNGATGTSRGNGANSNGTHSNGNGSAKPSKPVASGSRNAGPSKSGSRKPATTSAAKRYSFAGQAKQAPKAAARVNAGAKPSARPAAKRPAAASSSARPAPAKRRG